MRIWKTVLILLVLANWFACTLYCQSEKLGLFSKTAQLGAVSQNGFPDLADNSDSQVCDWVTNGGLHVSDTRVSAPEFTPLPLLASIGFAFSDLAALSDEPRVQSQWSLAPPELLRPSVHFVFRTALPARAPSLA